MSSSFHRPGRFAPTGTSSFSLEAKYGAELVQFISGHLFSITASFGFFGERLAEGLRIILSDDDALHGAMHAIFDADGDGVVTAVDLATVLGLARPFFGTSHVNLTAKFTNVLGTAKGPFGYRIKSGIERALVPQAVYYNPPLDVWMLQPVVQTAEWMMRRASAEDPALWPQASGATADGGFGNANAEAVVPHPPKLRLCPWHCGTLRRRRLRAGCIR